MKVGPMKYVALAVLVLCSFAFAKNKQEYQTGHVVGFNNKHWISSGGSNSVTSGTIDNSGNVNLTSNSSEVNWKHVTYYLTIETTDYIYFASRTLSFRFQRSPEITENADIKYSIHGQDLVLVTDSGREFKMKIDKRRKK